MNRARQEMPGHILLRLLGHEGHQNNLPDLSEDEWTEILRIADQHRLLPLIHARLERGEMIAAVPQQHRDMLRAAHRTSALEALAHRAELFSATEMLRAHGIESVALKGAWLAWYAYPEAAERPVRDIDILVREDQALDAFHHLEKQGFVQREVSAQRPEAMIGSAKHLPPITSPLGIEFEIHMHAWEPASGAPWPMPALQDSMILENAQVAAPDDPCRYPNAQHMLMHLVIHAAYSHRFDVGPLVLFDIKYLLEQGGVSLAQFWRDAGKGGWLEGAALTMALVKRWIHTDTQIHVPIPVAPGLVDDCEALLVQDLAIKEDTGLLAGLSETREKSGTLGAVLQLWQRAQGKQRTRHGPPGTKPERWPSWFARRSMALTANLGRRDLHETARRKARIGQWLAPSPQAH